MASELYNTIDALSREKGIDPQIVVSAVEDAIVMATRKYYKTQENLRAVPDLVQHLFQTEVPEIYDGTVVIRAIAREAGERTKIAVMSKDKDVDAVGACVGMKGMRVQSIIRELRGEKIDIIEYHEDAVTFAEKALQQ